MKGDLQIALEINENISLAKRLAGQLNALVQITGYGEKQMLQNCSHAEKKEDSDETD